MMLKAKKTNIHVNLPPLKALVPPLPTHPFPSLSPHPLTPASLPSHASKTLDDVTRALAPYWPILQPFRVAIFRVDINMYIKSWVHVYVKVLIKSIA